MPTMIQGVAWWGVDAFHPRTEWQQTGFRMEVDFTRLPTAMQIGNVDTMVAHYTGAKNVPDGDPGEDLATMRDYLRAIERDYLANRTGGGYVRKSDNVFFPGYHTGYSFGIDWQGGAWEIRGFDFLPAATNQHNGHTVAVLFFVDGPEKANAAMWATARAIGRETRRRSKRADFKPVFTDHGSLTISSGTGTPTACAGAGIRSQLATEGQLDLEAAVQYFNLKSDKPSTLWASSDGLVAVRLEGHQVTARGDVPATIPVLSALEAAKFVYVDGLPSLSVQ